MLIRSLTVFVAVLVLSYPASILGWWGFVPIAFIAGVFGRLSSIISFLSTAMGAALFWLLSILIIDSSNNGLLSSKMAAVLPSSLDIYWSPLFIAFILAGLAGLSGQSFMQLFNNNTSAPAKRQRPRGKYKKA